VNAAYWLGNLAAWSAQAAGLIAAGGAAVWAFQLRAPRIRLGILAGFAGNLPVASRGGTVAPRRGRENRVHHGSSQTGLAGPRSSIFPAMAPSSAIRAGFRLRRAGGMARRGIRQTAPLAAAGARVFAASATSRAAAHENCAPCGVPAVAIAIRPGNVRAVAADGGVARSFRRIAGGYPGSHRLP
jgi:hypothetical protein